MRNTTGTDGAIYESVSLGLPDGRVTNSTGSAACCLLRHKSSTEHMHNLNLNLNHCIAAQDLLQQTIREQSIDVALLSEPYSTGESSKWVTDADRRSAIWSCGRSGPMQDTRSFQHFSRAKVNNLVLYSCYLPPSLPIARFGEVLDDLVEDARGRPRAVIAGDFNAWAIDWGCPRTDARGRILLEDLASLNLETLNTGAGIPSAERELVP
ncbi:uncharacterized protein [Drosophila tropicalis]|uniref:uncharacterized protein n=1 Tax=Drosophila tropicalis TaxID=46794 RepID=UPI0035ABBB34